MVALSSEPRNLSPIFLDINAGNWKAFNGLVDLDAALNPVPDLAVELPTVTDGGSGCGCACGRGCGSTTASP